MVGFYGDQLTVAKAREQIRETTDVSLYMGDKSVKKLPGYMNTFVYTLVDGTVVYRLYQTDIVKVLPNGTVVLNTGGYQTVTTASRMKDIFSLLHLPYGTFSHRGSWKFVLNCKEGWPHPDAVGFVDGMMITKKGKIILPGPAVAVQKMRVKVQAKIKKYCDLLAARLATGWMVPEAGDCMYCQMHTDEGKSLGDASEDVGHLISHLKEGYLMGSLLWNAYKEARVGNPQFCFMMDGHLGSEGKPKSPPDKWGIGNAKKHVKKYLETRLLKPEALKGMVEQGVQL